MWGLPFARRWRAAAALAVGLATLPVFASQDPPTFRGNVALMTVRVQVRADKGKSLPTLTATDFAVRIGSRTPPVLHLEQVPRSEQNAGGLPAKLFSWPKDQDAALYLLGFEADKADCQERPKMSINKKGVKIGWVQWSALPGCAPPGARVLPTAPK